MSDASTLAPPFLCPGLAGTFMEPEEFDLVTDGYEEGYRYELVHGVLVVSPIASAGETDPNEQLGQWLRNYAEGHPEGRCIDATMPQQYIPTSAGRRLADRNIWVGLGRMPDRNLDIATIAVEFVSKSRRDRRRDYVEKRKEYLDAGVREYWIVDRFQRRITVVTQGARGPNDRIVREDETLTTPLLPGFELSVARLLATADRWDGQEEPEF